MPDSKPYFKRLDEVNSILASQNLPQSDMPAIYKEQSKLVEITGLFSQIESLQNKIKENELIDDSDFEFKSMAEEENKDLKVQIQQAEEKLNDILDPDNEDDDKNAIVEIRAGAGGDEAALFGGDLYRMYTRFANTMGWKVEQISSNFTDGGGVKEVSFIIKGENVFKYLKNESGVHRVQRVPVTESSGRIHTSTATVAVLPEAENVDVQINPGDLRVDVYRASGHGGQSVNTTDSAVRITYLPTGLIVTCQDSKSQIKNRETALSVLKSRLYQIQKDQADQARASMRHSQVGTGDRSEKIRTYNFPQDRITDHRVKVSWHNIPDVLNGNIKSIMEYLNSSLKNNGNRQPTEPED
jgi:peptide chain release factor 1